MLYSYVRHDSCICETRFVYMWDMIIYMFLPAPQTLGCSCFESKRWGVAVLRGQITCEMCLVHMWDMTHSYVRHDSFICATRLIQIQNTTYLYVRHNSFTCISRRHKCWVVADVRQSLPCQTCFIHMSHMTYSYVRHISFICETCFIHMWDTSHLCVSPYATNGGLQPHFIEWGHTYVCVMSSHVWVMSHTYTMSHDICPCATHARV